MSYKRILTIQDISCVGQCSLTVALPILSACGVEASILPSAVLSTHTAGFTGFTFRDLADDMPAICNHWKKENIQFCAIYTGYLGSISQVDYVLSIREATLQAGGRLIVDPAMADNGKLYPIFDMAYAREMGRLCAAADYILPNITEACFLTGMEYKETYDESYIEALIGKLQAMGCKNVVLTGVSYRDGFTGILVAEGDKRNYYEHEKLPNSCHGTGDIYASAFVGAFTRGKTAVEAAKIAADYTVECIRYTATLENHWYGAAFEPVLGKLIGAIEA